jgi:bifunctional DNase/RNase
MKRYSHNRTRTWALGVCCAATLAACRAPQETETEVEVRSVGFDSLSHAPVVVLQDHDRRVALPIWIGPAEAQAIAMQMQGIAPPRPMTHDLIKSMLDQASIELRKVVIQDLKASTYVARIYLHTANRDLQIDSRPSDAIALAVRCHSPIFVATGLLNGNTTIDLQHEAATASTLKIAGVTLQNLTDELAEYFSLPPGTGVLVADVASDAAPGAQGLQRGDVILEVDGTSVSGVGDFDDKMHALKKGAQARLSVQRGRQRLSVQFKARAG